MSTWCRTSRRTTSPTRCDTDALVMRSAAITGHALLRPCLVPHRRAARLVIPIAVASAISVDSEGRCQRAEAVPRANGGIHGSLTDIIIGVGVSSTQKVWHSLQAFSDITFAYSFSNILIEIQDTIKAPPPLEAKVMKSATRLSVVTTTVFYMLCGCMGYALPDNLLMGFGFTIVVHLVGAYQVFVQPIFVFVER
ncbi:hypothetical protein OsJ_08016 [Oryza sativa Japonica Group]|uniref:Amino acid transporter transmembrane domain-containing protein n=1 Tax=Oryza sativa subsp. japonica TaxID=39947 RepID=A3AAC7_ORYSJ|nr:hypothetical protein OsJ_08016 [Oryza sativa Japonica Group]